MHGDQGCLFEILSPVYARRSSEISQAKPGIKPFWLRVVLCTSSSTQSLLATWLSLQFTKKPAIDTILLIIMRFRLGTKHSICCLLKWGNMGRACIWWHHLRTDWTMMFHTKSTLDVQISCSFTSGVKTITSGKTFYFYFFILPLISPGWSHLSYAIYHIHFIHLTETS